jgi:hypothetical protein
LFDGSQTVTAIVSNDNNSIVFTYPSPGINYAQYTGSMISGVQTDSVSQYFLFKPSLVPVLVRSRLITNTLAATVAPGFFSNQTITVNALTRTDMLVVSNQIASLTAGQTNTFTRPVELITLGLVTSAPVVFSVTPNCGPPSGGTPITVSGFNFTGNATVTIGGVSASNVVVSSTSTLTAITPPGIAGPRNVVVTVLSSLSPGNFPNGFTYVYPDPGSFGGVGSVTSAVEAATLTWSAATGTGDVYNVYQGTTSGAENFASPVASTTNLSAFITPLYPGSNAPITYFFVVRAATLCGDSESNTVEVSVQPLLDPNKSQVGDGIANWWKQQYGFNPFDPTVAAADPDGDGMSNLQEFLAGTNPTNNASAFRIVSVVPEGSNWRITWKTAGGRTNAVQGTAGSYDNLGNPSNPSYTPDYFDDISFAFVIPGSGDAVTNWLDDGSWLGSSANWPVRYYRIRLVP